MASDRILFIMEGKQDENILNNLVSAYSEALGISENVIVAYTSNIYSLFDELRKLENSAGEFADFIEILKERSLESREKLGSYSRDDFSQIFLFFDLDIHKRDLKKSLGQLTEMCEKFDNETENGKLYISYPMVEAADMCCRVDGLFDGKQKLFLVEDCENDGFKKFKNEMWRINKEKMIPASKNKEDWDQIIGFNFEKANWIVNKIEPKEALCAKDMENLTQQRILECESDFVENQKAVAVLSAYPFWLMEYLGIKRLENLIHAFPA